MDRQKNDSTLSKLGDIYQYYIALLDCFKMQEGDKIQIEIQGDVTLISGINAIFQKEVKHHTSNKKLSDRDGDLWNTLKNWITYYSKSIQFSELVLFTTADIATTSIYYDWNEKTKEEKYNILYEVGQVKKDKEEAFRSYYNDIFDGDIEEEDICNLIEKFKIEHLQPKIQDVSARFSSYLIPIPDVNRDNYIATLLGMILKKVKEPPHKWEVAYDDFQKIAQDISPVFMNPEKIPLPLDFQWIEPGIKEINIAKEKVFVKELERIEYNKIIHNAISDYWKMTKTVARYFSDNISYTTSLNAYRKSLSDSMFYAKESVINEETLTSREQEIKYSKALCSTVLSWEAKDFGSIVGNQSFFKNGIVHNIVDDKEFTWDVGDEE